MSASNSRFRATAEVVCCAVVILFATQAMAAGKGEPCGGVVGARCDTGLVCDLTACGSTAGVCTAIPQKCPQENKPVCGCNKTTYPNDCVRLQSAEKVYVGKDHDGECAK